MDLGHEPAAGDATPAAEVQQCPDIYSQPESRRSTPDILSGVPSPTNSTETAGMSLISSPTPTQIDPFATAISGTAGNGTPSISSWSSNSDRQLGHAYGDDRVFPIRSVLTVDNSGHSGEQSDYFPQRHSHEDTPQSPRGALRSFMDLAGPVRRPGPASEEPSSSTVTSPSERVGRVEPGGRQRQNTGTGSVVSIHGDFSRHTTFVEPVPISLDDDSSSDEGGRPPSIPAVANTSEPNDGQSVAADEPIDERLTNMRFEHVVTAEGHAVITGRSGKLQRCEDEPIHAPGAVQGFGALVALAEDENGCHLVRYASENTKHILGYSPQRLFSLENFFDILSDEQAENMQDHMDFIRDEEANPEANGPEVFSISIRLPKADQNTRIKPVKIWCAMHINPARPEMVVCEFELDDDEANPLRPPGEVTPEIPTDTLQANPTAEELMESTEVLSKPIRVLRSARKRRGEAGAMQIFDIMSQVQEQLATADNLEKFLKILVGIVSELTGFHRVMIYQFDSEFNGRVVTELVDTAQTRDLYKGLHFPASDIPKQARDLYKINKVRLLYDRDQPTACLVCRSTEDLDKPLDLTHSYLRAMSPIHLKYLNNMAVRSSMSISIKAFDELWGLIACHSYGPRGMRVSFPIRKMCRLVGDTASRNIERLSYASRLQARKLINTVPTDKNPSGYIVASSDDLLKLFDADFGAVSIRGETKILGKPESTQEILVLLEYLRMKKFTSVLTSQDLTVDFADLRYAPGFQMIAGVLYVPLSVGGNDFIVFFRQGQVRQVKWAGNPYEKVVQEGTQHYLEPRKSFKVWHETVVGKCRDWSEEQVETAAVLCLVYGKFIEVWRQKEAALQSSKLTKLLLANSAHEVRTPLNAIINYLEIALEGSLDQETRDNLSKSHSASKSLIYVINDLLDLTKAEEGQELIKDEIFDLPACIHEATESFTSDAKRKGIGYEVIEHPGLPRAVYGDQRKVRQAVANVTANAVQHTSQGFVKIEFYVVEVDVEQHKVKVEIAVQDTGSGMSNAQLDALFRDLEQVSIDDTQPLDPTGPDTTESNETQSPRTLGLGIAVVGRIVRNMNGQLRLKSEVGKGSRFVMQFPFDMPTDDSPMSQDGSSVAVHSVTDSNTVSLSGTGRLEGEVTLIDGGPVVNETDLFQGPSPKRSLEDAASINSRNSVNSKTSLRSRTSVRSKGSAKSNISDADRLIDAIQLPLEFGEPDSQRIGLERRNSKGAYYQAGPSSHSRRASVSPTATRRSDSLGRSSAHRTEGAMSTSAGAPVGMQYVTDAKMPMKPVRIADDDELHDRPQRPHQSQTSGVLFELPDDGAKPPRSSDAHSVSTAAPSEYQAPLRVLCAEDDPINMKLLRKRLEKAGHVVSHTVNGADCASVYKELPSSFDVILMDMQMPIVDGLDSTKMIRAFELEEEKKPEGESTTSGRTIPIIAVSASLLESKKSTYVEAGFDGWILKPIDFKRLETLLTGIGDSAVRNDCLYEPGCWERGGWFFEKDQIASNEASGSDAEKEKDEQKAP
ncbi:hypothetical protein MCOR27_005337 [Pyricularia oryzae]|uniref:Phytochrome n=1 Tax=Pyricularia grisea TaxID=148305 RepID=A0ABQ8N8P9_PYRGI|nr:hypothetical protein MCOR01_008980 [Pyricularia oryzae]KAI6293104.1 hypothetical protein MCOR33_009378 [Pyricularia grisea]KAI6254316.1 hypothetical protein MCOR19_009162 [Pyricularia oryzae]KAI6279040.1 hypothetical protein MCOR27_005337 [Pyricularia oryzae]KAI6281764.1 hypothetical protein MCOR26_003103 [Pyricularia oryzae]